MNRAAPGVRCLRALTLLWAVWSWSEVAHAQSARVPDVQQAAAANSPAVSPIVSQQSTTSPEPSTQDHSLPAKDFYERKNLKLFGLGWTIKPSGDEAFVYRKPQSPNYYMAGGYQLAILLTGVAYYYANKSSNTIDWYYNYSFATLRDKLIGKGYSFDNNVYDTNFIDHSLAGTLYYTGARGNRLTPLGSLGMSFVSSAIWELLGEFRERISINDMLATPFGGAAFGESLFQLGAFFDRSCDTTANRVWGSIFAPSKALADYMDGAQLLRAKRCSASGLTRLGEHRIDFRAGPRLLHDWGAAPAQTRSVGEVAIDTEIVNLTRYGRHGKGWTSFGDGNISSLALMLWGNQNGRADFRFRARSMFGGLHYRHIDHSGPYRKGYEAVLGAGVGVEYSRHKYAAQQREDPFYVLEVPSLQARTRFFDAGQQLDLQLVLATIYSGAGAFAMDEYIETHPASELTTVAAYHGYNHGLGVSLSPRVEWSSRMVRVGFQGRTDRIFIVRALDGNVTSMSRQPVSELRRRGRLWIEIGPRTGFRWQIDLAGADRWGRIDTYQQRMYEVSAGTSLKFGF